MLLHTRNGIFQVRLYKDNRQYIHKSLKTRDLNEAREAATRAYYELEFRKREKLPLQIKLFSDVLNEYLRMREQQHKRGTYKHKNKANQQQTSIHMLRQMVRVSRFWHAYCGKRAVDGITNEVLRDYVAWRRDYYTRMTVEQ